MNTMDPSSYARIGLEKTEHIHLNLDVNFTDKILTGSATYKIRLSPANDDKLVLDVSKLNIKYIKLNVCGELRCLNFTETDLRDGIGSKLTIFLPANLDKKELVEVIVHYSTCPEASGLQWLEPSQTSKKLHPYLFSQFQAIHARSAFPCQDTPGVKCTYSAHITHPPELKALMSAICTESNSGESKFEQKVPVPSYLFCIAVGDLVSRELGPNSAVWSEEGQIEACAYEFAETCDILKVAEEICGPYIWGRYDLLVLPPSFPFGGMENPCLTFVTPTLLAGDRSLVDVVAHEIAHSWTGNLVTNCNFEHFWLNEGFTVFVECKIQGKMHGDNVRDFQSLAGLTVLKEEIKRLGETNPLTALVVNLDGLSPDDAFSSIPYMKGSLFLRYLEQLLGGECVFGCFLKKYLDHFKYKSIDTNDFKDFLTTYFKDNPKVNDIDWNTWLNAPGMPPVIPKYDETILNACKELVEFWVSWNTGAEFPAHLKSMSSSQIVEFLSLMIEKCPLTVEKLQNMDAVHKLDSSGNAEIRFRWLRLCILSKWDEKIEPALKFVTDQGRMKFVRPLYRDMYGWETSRARAIENFKKYRNTMMYVSAYTVAKDLKLES